MRIVDQVTFLKMPTQTLYSRYDRHAVYDDQCLGHLAIKGETLERGSYQHTPLSYPIVCGRYQLTNGWAQDPSMEREYRANYTDPEIELAETFHLFVVYDQDDVKALMDRLLSTVQGSTHHA